MSTDGSESGSEAREQLHIKQEQNSQLLNDFSNAQGVTTPPRSHSHPSPELPSGERMPPPPQGVRPENGHKRSRGNDDDPTSISDSSQTLRGDGSTPGQQDKQSEGIFGSSATIAPAMQYKQSQSQPAFGALSDAAASQKAPPSGQGDPGHKQPRTKPANYKQASKASTSKQSKRDQKVIAEGESQDDTVTSDLSTLDEPQERIQEFDWGDHELRYHAKMKELSDSEQMVFDEFNQLVNYFSVWASVGNNKEVDRGFKRLKTQQYYVQHREDELEQKRQHYIKVVEAFKSALQLLGN